MGVKPPSAVFFYFLFFRNYIVYLLLTTECAREKWIVCRVTTYDRPVYLLFNHVTVFIQWKYYNDVCLYLQSSYPATHDSGMSLDLLDINRQRLNCRLLNSHCLKNAKNHKCDISKIWCLHLHIRKELKKSW